MSITNDLFYDHPNPQVKEFLTKCMKLVMSLRIHSKIQAELLNDYSDTNGITYDPSDKSTWLYYKQISDQYNHGITVFSLDTLYSMYDLPFRNSSWTLAPRTRLQYDIGSYDLRKLMEAHPYEELALWAALYPVDITTAINSDDHQILAYDTSLIEEQEDNLIYELQKHINLNASRWLNRFYARPDSFYYGLWVDQLTKSLFLKVLNVRLSNNKTNKAHSFHIRMYLSGYYELDKYMDYLNREQQMYLYRNIDYISRNTGMDFMFHQLKDELLTKRAIPISEVSIRHIDAFDNMYLPDIKVRYKPINNVYESEIDLASYADLVQKENKQSQYNREWYQREGSRELVRLKTSPSSVVQTKILHSRVTDYSNSEPYALIDSLYQHWGYLSRQNKYSSNTRILFTDPRNLKEYSLSPYEAFVYHNMVLTYSLGLHSPSDTPLHFGTTKFLHVVKYTTAQIQNNIATHKLALTSLGLGIQEESAYAQELIDLFISYDFSTSIVTPEQLYTYSYSAYEFYYKGLGITHSISSPQLREVVYSMLTYFFTNEEVGTSYGLVGIPSTVEAFFEGTQLNPNMDMTPGQYEQLLLELFKQSTGYFVDDKNKITSIQKAMVGILKILSSYVVQFITEANDRRLLPLEAPTTSFSHEVHVDGLSRVNMDVGIKYASLSAQGASSLNSILTEIGYSANTSVNEYSLYEIATLQGSHDFMATIGYGTLAPMYSSANYVGRDSEISDKTYIVGLEYYLALTPEQKAQMVLDFS